MIPATDELLEKAAMHIQTLLDLGSMGEWGAFCEHHNEYRFPGTPGPRCGTCPGCQAEMFIEDIGYLERAIP